MRSVLFVRGCVPGQLHLHRSGGEHGDHAALLEPLRQVVQDRAHVRLLARGGHVQDMDQLLQVRRLARRLEVAPKPNQSSVMAGALALSLVLSVWVAGGDAALANSARTAAAEIHHRATGQMKRILFSGHWGFQYYMQSLGGVPIDSNQAEPTLLDMVVIPRNNTNTDIPLAASEPEETVSIRMNSGVTTVGAGAGFYSSLWGPLPYAFEPVPDERYDLYPVEGIRSTPHAR